MPEISIEPILSSTLSSSNPFPGLRPYEEADANWFFGRGGEINELLKRLRRLHLVAVVGASGSGKSSLVRAGVLPQLRDGYLDSNWTISTFRPGERPIANLAEAVCPRHVDLDEFSQALRSGSMGLVRGLASAGDKKLILVDQFEELFQFARRTGDSAQEEVKEFLKLLLTAANSDDVEVYVILTMRLEWLNECSSYPGLAEAINEGIYLVPQMTRQQFQQAILGPLEAADGSLTMALLGRMLNDLDNKTDQLPVLQHALMRIWERTGSTSTFDTAEYESVGTFSKCLSAHAEEVYGELTGRQKTVAELLFRSITQVYQNRKIRRPQSVEELVRTTAVGAAELEAVIRAFSRAGRSFLVTTAGALTPKSIIDVSHEALIRQWVRLCAWVEDEADKQSRVTRLGVDAAEWNQDRRQYKGSLYQGYRLQRAEELRTALPANSASLDFLNESRRVKLRQRIIRRGSITLAVLLVFGFLFALYRVRSQGQLAVAEAQSKRAEAEAKAAGLQAKKAQDFQDDLVKKIDAAKGSPTALAAIAKDIQAERVYVEFISRDVRLAQIVQSQLQKQGYAVPGLEQVEFGKAPALTQVRFFNAVDRADAGKLAASLRPLVAGFVQVQSISNPQGVVPAGQFEVWLMPDIAAATETRAAPPVAPPVAAPLAAAPSTPVAVPAPTLTASLGQERLSSGSGTLLSWTSEYASEVQIDGIGMVEPSGSITVTPKQSTKYRITAKNASGTVTWTRNVEVLEAPAAPAATAPAVIPSASVSSAQPAVRAAMTRYQDALQSESLDDMRKAWPSMSKNDQKNMKIVFDQFNAIRLILKCRDEDIQIEGTSASARCSQAVTYSQKGKKLPEQTSTNTFRFKKAGESWVLDGIQ